MANERKIRVSTELDTSGMMQGINQIRQILNSLSVDSNLFKDVTKDLDKISKETLEIQATLKNGIPEKGITSFLNKIENVNRVYTSLPDKIKQVQINANNIRFSDAVLQQIETLDKEIQQLSSDAKNLLGDKLKNDLRKAIPQSLISDDALKGLTEAKNKTEAFTKQFDKMAQKAENAKTKVENTIKDISNTIVKDTDKNAAAKRQAFSQFGANALTALQNGTIFSDPKQWAQEAANIGALSKDYSKLISLIEDYQKALQDSQAIEQQRQSIIDMISQAETDAAQKALEAANLTAEQEKIIREELERRQKLQASAANAAQKYGDKTVGALKEVGKEANTSNQLIQKQDSLLKQLAARATSLVGIGAIFNYITRGIRDAWNGIKDLDKEFTAIAVVTDKTTSQLWDSFSTYSQMAQALGVATKDAVATSALYYQQGLKTADVMTLTAETIKMAQIAGMDFATATNQMTAAIRGFNLEMEDASKVNDIFSTLAANAAVSTQELSYALTKTASIAESAGMSIDTTSAFLTKMIETTREAPENIGTAMKSIVARFEELKKNPLSLTVEVEGEEVVANKVESAIALAGVALRDAATGQFRDLDNVFLELAKAWGTLDRNTQRYIATIAAGSRQQSRFIAMMDGYERTVELVELAQDSEGQSAAQFLKTLDSLDSKLNQVGNSLEQLYQKFVDSDLFGGLLSSLNDFLQGLGKLDASTLATYALVGVTIANTIVNSIKNGATGFAQAGTAIGQTLARGLNEGINKTKIGQKVFGFFDSNKRVEKLENLKNENLKDIETQRVNKINKITEEITSKYNINTDDAEKNLSELKIKLEELQNELKEENRVKLTTDEIIDLEAKRDELASIIADADAANADFNAQEKELRVKADEQIEAIKQYSGQAMIAVGNSIATSLVASIVTALDSGDAKQTFSVGISTLAISALPQVASAFMAAAGPVMMNTGTTLGAKLGAGINAGLAATGPAFIFLAIGAAIIALVAGITWAVSNIKSDSQRLQEDVDKLTEKQKELDEIAERSQAEAAVSKTSYNRLNKLVDTYDELSGKINKTAEEQEQLNTIQEDLAKDFPDLVWYYDEAGNAVLKQREEWEKIIDLQKESAKIALGQATTDKLNSILNEKRIADKQKELEDISLQSNIKSIIEDRSRYNVSSVYSKKELKQQLQNNFTSEDLIDIGQFTSNTEFKIQATEANTKVFNELIDNAINGTTTEKINSLVQKLEIDDNQKQTLINQIKSDTSGFFEDIASLANDLALVEKDLTPAQQKAKQAEKKANDAIASYYETYINSFIPEEQIEDFSKVGINRLSQSVAKGAKKQDLTNIIQGTDFWSKAVETGAISEARKNILVNQYKEDVGTSAIQKTLHYKTNYSHILPDRVILDKVTDKELLTELEEIASKISDFNLEEQAQEFAEFLPQIQATLTDEEFALFNTTDLGNLSAEEIEALKSVYDKINQEVSANINWTDAIGQELENIQSRINQWSPNLQEFANKFGANLAEALSKSGVSDAELKGVENIFSQYSKAQQGSLTNLITNINWEDNGQVKQLAAEFIKYGDTVDNAVEHTLKLKQLLDTPIKMSLDADKAVADMSEIAGSLNEIKKSLSDLNSAVQEYNENGRLSGETILNLIENGHLMYLEYDKETKAITINKDAMVDYYNAQVNQVKLNLELKKIEAQQSLNTLKQRKINLEAQKKILEAAYDAEGHLTADQYEALTTLNNTYDQETLTNTNNYLTDLLTEYQAAMAEIAQAAASGGQAAHDNFFNHLINGENAIDMLDIAGTKENISNLLSTAQTLNRSEIVDYTYQLDQDSVKAAIDKLDAEIKATDAFIEAQQKYNDYLDKGINFTNALTESGLDNFMNDTAKAASDANKELKEYVTTLEKYYNLLKNVEHAEEDYERAKKEYDRNPTIENYRAMQDARVNYGKELIKQRDTFKLERDEDVQRGVQKFIKFGLKSQDAQSIMTLTDRGDINQDELRPWLQAQGYDYDTAEAFEKIWNEVKSEIEEDNKNIKDADDKIYDINTDLEDDLKNIEEELLKLDRLKNVEQALSRLDKLMTKAANELEMYYESGGKEGMSLEQYLHTQGAALQELKLANEAIGRVKTDFISENKKLLDEYAIEVDGEWYLNPDTIGNLDVNGETYKTLEGIFEQLNKIKDKEDEITDKQRDYAKAAKEALKVARKSYSDLVMKAANALAELDQKEIDEVKKKYAMIQEEDEKYLTSLQKSIDKQRQLRDQAKSYDDLEKQEKRLALLERDTSGANAAEIAALKEQIKDARQNLVDTEQDNIVNNIAEANETRKEKMNEETEFLQNVMDERTYDMQYYIERAQDIVNAAIDGDEGAYKRLLEILQETDEAYFKGTAQMREIWMEEWNTEITTASGYVDSLKNGTVVILGQTTKEILDTLDRFAKEDIGEVTELENKVNGLNKVTKEVKMDECFNSMKEAIEKAKDKLDELLTAADTKVTTQIEIQYTATGDVPGGLYGNGNTPDKINDTNKSNYKIVYDSSANGGKGKSIGIIDVNSEEYKQRVKSMSSSPLEFKDIDDNNIQEANELFNKNIKWGKNTTTSTITKTPTTTSAMTNSEYNSRYVSDNTPNIYSKNANDWWNWWNSEGKFDRIFVDYKNGKIEPLSPYDNPETKGGDNAILEPNDLKTIFYDDNGQFMGVELQNGIINGLNDELTEILRKKKLDSFDSGGRIDYDGLALVHNHEAVLTPEDTRNLDVLMQALSEFVILSHNPTSTEKSEVNSGDTNIEIHIDIEKIEDDYDVDQMLDEIQARISEASEGQVTIVR